jgi:hypothetical protein
MGQQRSYRASLIFAAAMAGSVLASGAVAGSKIDDPDHRDYGRWHPRAAHAYRQWLARSPQAERLPFVADLE